LVQELKKNLFTNDELSFYEDASKVAIWTTEQLRYLVDAPGHLVSALIQSFWMPLQYVVPT
jgi:hypothetical protein